VTLLTTCFTQIYEWKDREFQALKEMLLKEITMDHFKEVTVKNA
jgi:hypothetical protein